MLVPMLQLRLAGVDLGGVPLRRDTMAFMGTVARWARKASVPVAIQLCDMEVEIEHDPTPEVAAALSSG